MPAHFYSNALLFKNMKIATISELKQELNIISASEVKELCLRLARYKKENKELLTYLIFEAHNEQGYIDSAKIEIKASFANLTKTNLHLAKKSLRKILRSIAKYARHTGTAQSHIEMLLEFCTNLKQSGIPFHRSVAIENIYASQIKKIHKLLDSLHEDLRFDYSKELSRLENK
jgi:hypothetical protein